jgi:hypothetical protein
MTRTAVVLADTGTPEEAGASIGARIVEELGGISPDAVIVFASPRYAEPAMLRALKAACQPYHLVGCCSAGEFTSAGQRENAVSAIALSAPEMRFTAALATDVSANTRRAAETLAEGFAGLHDRTYRYHSALVLTDALAGHADELIEHLTRLTAGMYQFFGGGGGDNALFSRTPVLFDTRVVPDAVVTLELLSNAPIGIGVQHGWEPASPALRVTESEGLRLVSLNAMPAVEAVQAHASATGQRFDPENPLPFFLHNILGISSGSGYKLRVPLAAHEDGSISCAAEIPSGATVHIMRASATSSAEAAAHAARAALNQLDGRSPRLAIFFDCVATRLRLGREFGLELSALQEALSGAQIAGCNTHGQIARAEGQFSGFHNCTAVVCALP